MKTSICLMLLCLFTLGLSGCDQPTPPPEKQMTPATKPTTDSTPSSVEKPMGDDFELVGKVEKMASIVKEDGKGHIIHVDMRTKTFTGADLEELKGLKKLESLMLNGTAVTDDDLMIVGQLKTLRNLDLRGCKVSNAGMAHLTELSNLRALRLSGQSGDTTVDDGGLEHIGKLTNLKALLLDFLWVSGEGLAKLKDLNNLEELYLAGTLVGDEDLKQVALFPTLKKLRISKLSQVTGAGLAHVKALENLIDLDISEDSSLFDADMEQLAGMAQLERLNLWRVAITDSGVEHLKGLTKMKWLNLDNTQLSDAGMVYLKDMQQIDFMHLGSTAITDAGLPELAGLKTLKVLMVTRTAVTEEGVSKLKESLPEAEIQLKYLGEEN